MQLTVPPLPSLSSILSLMWLRITGAGALSSPLVSTQFAQLPHWSFHYLVSLGIAVSNTIVLCFVFGTKTQDGTLSSPFPPASPILKDFPLRMPQDTRPRDRRKE
jgi:hypothetical protein